MTVAIASKSSRRRCCRPILIQTLIITLAFLTFLSLVMSTIIVFNNQELDNADALMLASERSLLNHPSRGNWKNLRKRHEQRLSRSQVYWAPSNELEFVHITKTGGTAVEAAAAAANITWGVCHFEFQPQLGPACMRPNWAHLVDMERQKEDDPLQNERNATNVMPHPPWHAPMHWLAWVEQPKNTTATPVTNPYRKSKTFTIVRNPYDRIISEYYCKFFGYHREEYQRSRNKLGGKVMQSREQREENDDQDSRLNKPIERRLEERCERDTLEWEIRHRDDRMALVRARRQEMEGGNSYNMAVPSCRHLVLASRVYDKTPPQSRRENDMAQIRRDRRRINPKRKDSQRSFNFWIRRVLMRRSNSTGHLLPQHYYVYDNEGNQIVNHIIRFENITSEFDELMRLYGLNVSLSQNEKINQGHQSAEGVKFSTKDFSQYTLNLINEVYQQDFELLGYPKLMTSGNIEPEVEDEELEPEDEDATTE